MSTFQKNKYENRTGYSIRHTIGTNAKASTVSYPHICVAYLVYYFVSGSGNITVEGNTYKVSAGEIFITNPGELFICSIDPDAYHERIVLHIDYSFLAGTPLEDVFTNREKGKHNRISANLVSKNGLNNLFHDIIALAKTPNDLNALLEKCKVTELLIKLNKLKESIHAEKTYVSADTHVIAPILAYLNKHYIEPITVATLAEQFAISQSHLSHIFKQATGLSVINFVILQRMHHSNRLVLDGCSIEKACYDSGFHNYSNFYRLYKKYNRMTPLQFKMQHQKKQKKKA